MFVCDGTINRRRPHEIVQPNAVIPSHANEVVTKDGKLLSGTKTETLKNTLTVPMHLPLSGKTMQSDGSGTCVSGC